MVPCFSIDVPPVASSLRDTLNFPSVLTSSTVSDQLPLAGGSALPQMTPSGTTPTVAPLGSSGVSQFFPPNTSSVGGSNVSSLVVPGILRRGSMVLLPVVL